MSSESYHEPYELLSEGTRNMHRALVSTMEELEAIDWYQQRLEACSDPELSEILTHNKHEEVEHALMTLEWIRRHLPKLDEMARQYMFRDGPIVEDDSAEEEQTLADRSSGVDGERTLGLGSLRTPVATEGSS